MEPEHVYKETKIAKLLSRQLKASAEECYSNTHLLSDDFFFNKISYRFSKFPAWIDAKVLRWGQECEKEAKE